jgi:hypothetical protein
MVKQDAVTTKNSSSVSWTAVRQDGGHQERHRCLLGVGPRRRAHNPRRHRELFLGVRTERKGLEEIAMPLTAADAEAEEGRGSVGKTEGGAGAAGALAGT